MFACRFVRNTALFTVLSVSLVLVGCPPPQPSRAVSVPDVVGMTQAAAESAITLAGLTVGTVTRANSDTMPEGRVISQDPTGGSRVAGGTRVNLVISLGPEAGEGEGGREG